MYTNKAFHFIATQSYKKKILMSSESSNSRQATCTRTNKTNESTQYSAVGNLRDTESNRNGLSTQNIISDAVLTVRLASDA